MLFQLDILQICKILIFLWAAIISVYKHLSYECLCLTGQSACWSTSQPGSQEGRPRASIHAHDPGGNIRNARFGSNRCCPLRRIWR